MAAKKKIPTEQNKQIDDDNDIAASLISDLNKEFGTKIAFNLSGGTAPTTVKNWLTTNSVLLDYAIANHSGGGLPGGRIIELTGLPSTGKSHIAYEVCRSVQKRGGLVVYVDTENATMLDKLSQVGIDVTKRFVFIDTHCTEEVLHVIESTIKKAKSLSDKNIPILVVWDSIAASSPKAELEGEYDQNTIGLQARTLSKGMRKITGIIGEYGVTLLCLNQLRMKIGGTGYGDPYVSPGGSAIPYHSSVRIRLTGEGTALKNKDGNVIGIRVPLKIIKNKVAAPFRSFDVSIIFGKGIVEDEQLLDTLLDWFDVHKECTRLGKIMKLTGKGGAWKTLSLYDVETGEVLLEKKFTKNDFATLRKDPVWAPVIVEMCDAALTVTYDTELPAPPDVVNPVTDETDESEEEIENV